MTQVLGRGEGSLNYAIKIRSGRLRLSLFFSLSHTENTSVEGVSSAHGTLEYGDARLCGEGSLNYAIKIRSGRLRLSLGF